MAKQRLHLNTFGDVEYINDALAGELVSTPEDLDKAKIQRKFNV